MDKATVGPVGDLVFKLRHPYYVQEWTVNEIPSYMCVLYVYSVYTETYHIIHIYMYTLCVYLSIHTYIHTYIHIHIYIYIQKVQNTVCVYCIHIYIYNIHMCLCVCIICMYLHAHICHGLMYVSLHVMMISITVIISLFLVVHLIVYQ